MMRLGIFPPWSLDTGGGGGGEGSTEDPMKGCGAGLVTEYEEDWR